MTETLIVLSLEAWDGVWRRNQHVIDGLLRRSPELRVVFVEPSADVLHGLVRQRRLSFGRGLRPVDDYDGRLLRFQPTKWLPRLMGPAADRMLRRSVARALRHAGVRRGVLWVNDPSWAHLVRHSDWPALYDITDDWLAADRAPRERRQIEDNERTLFESCDAVVVCSTGLLASRGSARDDLVLIPNAVDAARYRERYDRPTDLPASPIALYAGTLHEDRLDVDLTVRSARALRAQSGSVVLVGPIALGEPSIRLLSSEPNLVLLGPRPHEEIPAYLQHADVLIVPHVVDGFTDSLDPIKLYEYRAAARPVVATPVAGFRDAADPAVVIADADEFPRRLAEATARPPRVEPAPDIADWSDRVDRFTDVLERIDASATRR